MHKYDHFQFLLARFVCSSSEAIEIMRKDTSASLAERSHLLVLSARPERLEEPCVRVRLLPVLATNHLLRLCTKEQADRQSVKREKSDHKQQNATSFLKKLFFLPLC